MNPSKPESAFASTRRSLSRLASSFRSGFSTSQQEPLPYETPLQCSQGNVQHQQIDALQVDFESHNLSHPNFSPYDTWARGSPSITDTECFHQKARIPFPSENAFETFSDRQQQSRGASRSRQNRGVQSDTIFRRLSPSRSEIYRLDSRTDITHGESQKTSDEFPNGTYDPECINIENAALNPDAIMRGINIFVPIMKGERLPGMPEQAENGDIRAKRLVDRSNLLVFFGAGAEDLSRLLHVLIVPKYDYVTFADDDEDDGIEGNVKLRWAFDLGPQHISLLQDMHKAGLDFVQANRRWFFSRYRGLDEVEDLCGIPLQQWIQPIQVQFGFHVRPTVGYLHLHMLVGPVTEFGASYGKNWISYDSVMSFLETGTSMDTVLSESQVDSFPEEPRSKSTRKKKSGKKSKKSKSSKKKY